MKDSSKIPGFSTELLARVQRLREMRQRKLSYNAATTRRIELEGLQAHLTKLSPAMRPGYLMQRIATLSK